MAGTDLLEQQGSPPLLSHRARRLAAALALPLILILALADWQVRRHEGPQVDGCAEAALSATSMAEGRVAFMTRYVSPALASSPPRPLRRGLLAMISDVAAPAMPVVRRAQQRCEAVSVVPTHTRLRGVRTDCLRLLSTELSYLASVVADGRHTFEENVSVPGRCASR
jgi:hypothetical protein